MTKTKVWYPVGADDVAVVVEVGAVVALHVEPNAFEDQQKMVPWHSEQRPKSECQLVQVLNAKINKMVCCLSFWMTLYRMSFSLKTIINGIR